MARKKGGRGKANIKTEMKNPFGRKKGGRSKSRR